MPGGLFTVVLEQDKAETLEAEAMDAQYWQDTARTLAALIRALKGDKRVYGPTTADQRKARKTIRAKK